MTFAETPRHLQNASDARQHRLFQALRGSQLLGWLAHRGTFVIGMPVLSAVGLATTFYIPRLVSPAEFGVYTLLLSLFRYAGRCDLGLTQLADRRLAVPRPQPFEDRALLDVRIRMGLIILFFAVPIAVAIARRLGFSGLDASVAVTAGLCAMIAGGPSTVFRAQGRIWEYTALAFIFSVGFILPRLVGFAIGGVTGCFALWLLWYGAMAVSCIWHNRNAPGARFSVLTALRSSLPLFVFAGTWTVYLTVDRWVAAILSTPRDLGLFSLGANLAMAAVITFSQISDVRYPRWLKLIEVGRPFEYSRSIEREALFVGALTAISAALVIPFVHFGVLHLFPGYEGAAGPMSGFAAACVPTMVVAWFLPVAIARSRSPVSDTLVLFLPATLAMAAGMLVGNRIFGIEGQAWACCSSAIVLLAGFAFVLRRGGILSTPSALRTVAALAVMVAFLAFLALTTRPARAGGEMDELVPPTGWSHVFCDRFTSLSLWDGQSGTWQAGYVGGERTNKTNRELEFYASPRDRAVPGSLQPFASGDNGLLITARPVSLYQREVSGQFPFVSGLLNSAHSFAFTYGYAVMRARIPEGRGLWPAFWLLPTTGRDPPELDVMEMIGNDSTRYYATLHSSHSGVSMHTIPTVALQQSYHDYGVLWRPQSITWFFDGRAVATVATPHDMHDPMYLLVNLAVGGIWPGPPDGKTEFPAQMHIAAIDVFQKPSDAGERRCGVEGSAR